MALAATTVALLGRWLLDPILGNYTPYIVLYASVAFSAIYAGFGPSMLATGLGLIGAAYWFTPPRGTFALSSVADLVATLAYLSVCTMISAAGEVGRRSKAKLNIAGEQLQQSEESVHAPEEAVEGLVQRR